MSDKERLDVLLVELGFYESRESNRFQAVIQPAQVGFFVI